MFISIFRRKDLKFRSQIFLFKDLRSRSYIVCTTEGFMIFMSKFSTEGFEISNFLPQKLLFFGQDKILFSQTMKNWEAKFQILFMQNVEKI